MFYFGSNPKQVYGKVYDKDMMRMLYLKRNEKRDLSLLYVSACRNLNYFISVFYSFISYSGIGLRVYHLNLYSRDFFFLFVGSTVILSLSLATAMVLQLLLSVGTLLKIRHWTLDSLQVSLMRKVALGYPLF